MSDKRIEPTDDERRNGWTQRELADYVARREREQLEHASFDRPRGKPTEANSKYRPTRWRG